MFNRKKLKSIEKNTLEYKKFIDTHAVQSELTPNLLIYRGQKYYYDSTLNKFSKNGASSNHLIHTPLAGAFHNNMYGYEVKETKVELEHQYRKITMVECIDHIGGSFEVRTEREDYFNHPLVNKVTEHQFKSKLIKHSNGCIEYEGKIYSGYIYSKRFEEGEIGTKHVNDEFIEIVSQIKFFNFTSDLSYREIQEIIRSNNIRL